MFEALTVSELIRELTAHDRDKVVVCSDDDGGWDNIQEVKDDGSTIHIVTKPGAGSWYAPLAANAGLTLSGEERTRIGVQAIVGKVLAKHQPCGCVVCTCEDDEQCHGCGAKHCGTHPVGEIPNPCFANS